MSDYQTPGVYVEEKSVLESSVSSISTAVPAFIGYTEIAGVNNGLYYKPTKITTLKEYEDSFGKAADEAITVEVDGDSITKVTFPETVKNMYYSMQMFFNNGGGSCYIVALSANDNKNEIERFEDAVDTLELEDETTLIVLVDGVNMANAEYYSVCQRVLEQCNTMKDRFAIFDVLDTTSVSEDAAAFRDGIGADYLKYGAAYYPILS